MAEKDNENFKKSIKRWICEDEQADGDVKVRDHCHITGKYRISAHRDSNIKVFSWNAMFSPTKVEFELTSGTGMYLFFKKGMRNGVSYFSERFSKVINKYLKSYDRKQESDNNFYMVILCLAFFQ